MEGLTGHGAIRFMGNLRNEGARPDVPSVFRRPAPWQSELPPTDRRQRGNIRPDGRQPDRALGQTAGTEVEIRRPSDLGGLDDHLLVLLIYYRCYVTQEFLGFFYHVNKSAICRALQRVEALARPLIGVGRTPKISRAEAEALIVDCTEQPIQRPGTDAVQREPSSGKK